MASHSTEECTGNSVNDYETDYGSDFSPEEEEILLDLSSGRRPVEVEDNPIVTGRENHEEQALRIPRALGKEQRPLFQAAQAANEVAERIRASVADNGHSDGTDEKSPSIASGLTDDKRLVSSRIKESILEKDTPMEDAVAPVEPDTRSPLERFRTPPKKALSVTDLVSPAWCELQYWYTLTRHGKKIQTAAMKQGSVVHKKLEDEVHTTVKVDVTTKEDAWGLRIWNVIQGLRTLKATGQTRELEIWGIVDGLVVNGVIDELSFICPDKQLEEISERSSESRHISLEPNQTTISNYFLETGGISLKDAARSQHRSQSQKVYLCDVKTRSVRSLPAETAFRPTKMQLMLYHSLLSSLATNSVDFGILATRYDLDPLRPFSDSFVAQVGSLNDDSFYDTDFVPGGSQELDQWSQDSMTTLLAYNCLSALWSLMILEFQTVFPGGAASIGTILRAEYRKSDTGEVMGSKTFAMDEDMLKSYVDHEMQWWRGERQAQGVVIEEAFKCRSCEFADDCEWRLAKVEEATMKARRSRLRAYPGPS